MEVIHFSQWYKELNGSNFLTIAGPCSAESEEQLYKTVEKLAAKHHPQVIRAGIWKPRTRPGSFEGVGERALPWLKGVKEKYGFLTAVEVAKPDHVKAIMAIPGSVDIVWLGARTVTNPFSVQELAPYLKELNLPVLVKNPLHPDLNLWIGALERLNKAGIKKLAAIHRGFYPFENNKLRNIPKWEIPIELKTEFPELPIIGDPSHIAGDVCFIEEIAQKFLDLNFDGLMIEVHYNPAKALSDAKQQLTPEEFDILIEDKLIFRHPQFGADFINELDKYRTQIDSIDYQLLELLSKRMELVKKIGDYKNEHQISLFQIDRWRKIRETRLAFGSKLNLNSDFILKILEIVHKESINIQSKQKNNDNKKEPNTDNQTTD